MTAAWLACFCWGQLKSEDADVAKARTERYEIGALEGIEASVDDDYLRLVSGSSEAHSGLEARDGMKASQDSQDGAFLEIASFSGESIPESSNLFGSSSTPAVVFMGEDLPEDSVQSLAGKDTLREEMVEDEPMQPIRRKTVHQSCQNLNLRDFLQLKESLTSEVDATTARLRGQPRTRASAIEKHPKALSILETWLSALESARALVKEVETRLLVFTIGKPDGRLLVQVGKVMDGFLWPRCCFPAKQVSPTAGARSMLSALENYLSSEFHFQPEDFELHALEVSMDTQRSTSSLRQQTYERSVFELQLLHPKAGKFAKAVTSRDVRNGVKMDGIPPCSIYKPATSSGTLYFYCWLSPDELSFLGGSTGQEHLRHWCSVIARCKKLKLWTK